MCHVPRFSGRTLKLTGGERNTHFSSFPFIAWNFLLEAHSPAGLLLRGYVGMGHNYFPNALVAWCGLQLAVSGSG